jgi:hypothetical protein
MRAAQMALKPFMYSAEKRTWCMYGFGGEPGESPALGDAAVAHC